MIIEAIIISTPLWIIVTELSKIRDKIK